MYRETSGEVLPKFCLGEERSLETDLIYASLSATAQLLAQQVTFEAA